MPYLKTRPSMEGNRLLRILIASFLLSTLLAACAGTSAGFESSSSGQPAPELHDLAGIDDLKSVFNADQGSPRLLLLMAPT